jgi:hypothetical protein
MRLLIAILKAHDLPEFDSAVENVLSRFDKIIYHWYWLGQCRPLMRRAFLESSEYTHLAILCDDLIVNEESVNKLLKHIETDEQKYGFVCGVANVDNTPERRNLLNVALTTAGKRRNYVYNSIEVGSEVHKSLLAQPQPVPIKHMGEPFPIIRKDIAAQFTFDLDDKIHGFMMKDGCCNDVVMSNEAEELGIPIWCDFTAFMYHLKTSEAHPIPLVVGTREPFTKFVPATY